MYMFFKELSLLWEAVFFPATAKQSSSYKWTLTSFTLIIVCLRNKYITFSNMKIGCLFLYSYEYCFYFKVIQEKKKRTKTIFAKPWDEHIEIVGNNKTAKSPHLLPTIKKSHYIIMA